MDAFFDWFGREGGAFLSWWLLAALAGVAAWPLSFRLLGGLPDRGYALARSLGLVLVGYVFWLAASLGFIVNSPGSVVLAWMVVLVVGVALAWPQRREMLHWLRENRSYILVTELLFAALFLSWVLVRAGNPSLTGTEKPMELAFMSATRRSELFPPNDPWMSGYAISYYYFGYVMAAMMASLSGVANAAAFNLMIPLLFALTGTGAFGAVYNLIRARRTHHEEDSPGKRPSRRTAMLFAILGMAFVVLIGNLQAALVEVPYQHGLTTDEYLAFWDGQERDAYPEGFMPRSGVNQWDYWWWFRASRIIQDRDLTGEVSVFAQPISEFPAFSFVLADMHPHVLALPFAVLALGLALNLLLLGRDPTRQEILLYGLCLGGLVFLNTWDGPIFMALLLGADALRRVMRSGGRLFRRDWWALVLLGVSLLAMTLVFYLPFFLGFRSQARGILPNLVFLTKLPQLFVMFGPFLIILGVFLAAEVNRYRRGMNWSLAWRVLAVGLLVLLAFLVIFGVVVWVNGEARGVVYSVADSAGGLGGLLFAVLGAQISGLPVALLLGGAILVVLARLFFRPGEEIHQVYTPARGFVLLLIAAGAVLALAPNYFYLWDNFSVRINTVFKFYYQAWLLWGVASAYAVYVLLAGVKQREQLPAVGRYVFGGVVGVLLIAGLSYTALAVYSRTTVEYRGEALTLNGALSILNGNVDDYAVLQCLDELAQDGDEVLVEALGPAYSWQHGRASALTGIPTVLGWENHERQWRGSTYDAVAGMRGENPATVETGDGDVATLYNTFVWEQAQAIIERYGIDYIFVGATERRDYNALGLQKFADRLVTVCQSGDSVVYWTEQ